MKKLAVEPVPTPTTLFSSSLGRMKSTAAWATAVAYGSAYYALPPGCSPYPYHTYTYYNCGGAYYQPQYEGDTVVYVSTPDPSTVTVTQ